MLPRQCHLCLQINLNSAPLDIAVACGAWSPCVAMTAHKCSCRLAPRLNECFVLAGEAASPASAVQMDEVKAATQEATATAAQEAQAFADSAEASATSAEASADSSTDAPAQSQQSGSSAQEASPGSDDSSSTADEKSQPDS